VTRLLSGAVLLALFGGAAWWAPPVVVLSIAILVAMLTAGEVARLASSLGAPVAAAPLAAAAALLCAAVGWHDATFALPAVIVVLLAFGVLAVMRGVPAPDSLARVASAVFGSIYVGVPLGTVVAVHWLRGREALLLLIIVIIVSDSAQYYTGRLLGRHPLAPSLSPKKTIEGAVGGVIFGPAAMAVIGHWWWPEASVAARLATGGALVVLGITGDLFESMLKRAAGVKDSSALIPGHGGLLDRIDALLFASPAYYLVLRHLSPAA
jgi:phosphatidate cytidylyltransferase